MFSQLHEEEEYHCPPGQEEPREALSDEAEDRLRALGLPPEEEARMRDVLEIEAGRIAALLRGSEPSVASLLSSLGPTAEELAAVAAAKLNKAVLTTVKTSRATLHRLVWTQRFRVSRDTHQPVVHTTPAYGTSPHIPVKALFPRPPPVPRAANGLGPEAGVEGRHPHPQQVRHARTHSVGKSQSCMLSGLSAECKGSADSRGMDSTSVFSSLCG